MYYVILLALIDILIYCISYYKFVFNLEIGNAWSFDISFGKLST